MTYIGNNVSELLQSSAGLKQIVADQYIDFANGGLTRDKHIDFGNGRDIVSNVLFHASYGSFWVSPGD